MHKVNNNDPSEYQKSWINPVAVQTDQDLYFQIGILKSYGSSEKPDQDAHLFSLITVISVLQYKGRPR